MGLTARSVWSRTSEALYRGGGEVYDADGAAWLDTWAGRPARGRAEARRFGHSVSMPVGE
jgi:hypothetical protein